jgi:hypothetical protein
MIFVISAAIIIKLVSDIQICEGKMTEDKSLEKKVGDCPLARWEFFDAMIANHGEYICYNSTRPNDPGEYGGPGDRPTCNEKDFISCEFYQKFIKASLDAQNEN